MLPRSSRGYETSRVDTPKLRRLRRIVGYIVLLFLLYEAVTTLFVQTVEQQTVAMEPTLLAGDRLITLPPVFGPRMSLFGWTLPGLRSPAYGDLVTIRPGYTEVPGFAARLADPLVRFFTLQNRRIGETDGWSESLQIKRVIGLPGDTIRMERFVAYVRPSGESEFFSEFALAGSRYEIITDERPGVWEPLDPFGPALADHRLGPGEYFVLSDHRSLGIDSRHWGPIDTRSIVAKVSLRYWPLARFGRP